jgi:uncharacterized protein DUF4276
MELVFMLEELSAKEFLDSLLPRILPPEISFKTIPHHGKTDLRASLPRKLRAWRNPYARFVVLHDQDANDCVSLKQQLLTVCNQARPDLLLRPLIRIACHELEAWHLGDLEALETAFPAFNADGVRDKAKFRDVDALANAAEELMKIAPEYQKVGGSRLLGSLVEIERNTSHSFQVFVSGIETLIGR